jgi:RNA polymerase sigma-70 factor (ECF subfamily)
MTAVRNNALILAARRGSVGAFCRLVFQYDADILDSTVRITGSEQDARRLYHEIMLRIHQELPKYRFDCAFYIWMYRHISVVSLDYLRRKRVAGTRSIYAELDALSPLERMVLEFKHYRSESLITIAEMLGMTNDAAANTLTRGIRKTRRSFDGHNPATS